MPLIYGLVSNDKRLETSYLTALEKTMRFENCIQFQLKTANFSGGILMDKSFAYVKDDFFYSCKNNRSFILFTGEIYNLKDLLKEEVGLREKLKAPELLLILFKKYGPEFIDKLNGDFVILLYAATTETTFIFRDHMGVKPAAYYKVGRGLLLSSDVLALAKVTTTEQNYNEQYHLQHFTKNNLWDYRLTPNKEVIKILPGHYLKNTSEKSEQVKYWFPENIKINKALDIDTAIADMRELLKDAVKIRSDNRFTAAAHVSGGLDSGVVAALSRKAYQAQDTFYGLSWSPEHNSDQQYKLDERNLAADICNHNGINLKLSNITKDDVCAYYADWRCRLTHFTEFKVRQDAKELGVNLIFSGWGGDEFISCPNRGIDLDLFFGLHWKALLEKYPLRKPRRLFGALYYNVLRPFFKEAYFPHYNLQYTSKEKYLDLKAIQKAKTKDMLLSFKSRRDVHLKFIYNYHIASRIEEWYILGERLGVEYRYPLLDKRIIEYALTIPSSIIYPQKRLIMRTICKNILPDTAIEHAKIGDQAYSEQFEHMMSQTFHELCKLMPYYEDNPYLSFVNFKTLKTDIKAFQNSDNTRFLPYNLRILFLMNTVHICTTNFID